MTSPPTAAAAALGILMLEHRQIERVLIGLARATRAAREGPPPPVELFRACADFARRFADDVHHRKEEDVLFAAMADAGLDRDRGPLACMGREHDAGRKLVSALARASDAIAAGDTARWPTLLDAARDYCLLLGQHIDKEDHGIYHLALQVLPASAWEGVLAGYDAVDADDLEAMTSAADAIEALRIA